MNYAGKFDAALSLDGQGFRAPASDHVDSFTAKAHGHLPQGAVVIEDPNLIFHGDFKRTGLDLVLSHEGHEFVVHDYFRGDKRAAIASPDGAHLTGDIVSALTGYVQVAQAAPSAAAAAVIGHVTKLSGSATAIRNGVSVVLNNGDNVEKGDVVSTGSDSTLGITFIDGTVFGLSSNARMVLNEMVYDPNGSNNSSLLSLVAGTITFVAGETAKHGDMKVDTPVATMGIRGTAVLNSISFIIPPGGGDPQPQVNFQVLVEPNGTTGSYILFDKVTLLPIATVNQAGQMIQISGGNVTVTNALLSPDVQKLITDVFTLKFTDNGTNTKLTTNFTDSITQNGNIVIIKTPDGTTAQATFNNTANTGGGTTQGGGTAIDRIPGAPFASVLDANGNVVTGFKATEHAGATGDRADTTGDTVPADTIVFRVNFLDQNLGDRPTVAVDVDASHYTYTDSGHHDVTASLTALQKQDIAATQVKISVVADGTNSNNGSATLTYTVPDHAFDFLGAGETLTLTYIVSVDNNFSVNPETNTQPITITITGTNDKPVITSSVQTITFSGGTSVPGGPLTTEVPTSGTLTFTDVDLTDTHTVAVSKFSAVLPGGTVPQSIYDFFAGDLTVSIASGHDSTGSGAGTVNWSLGDIPVYLADFIPKGQVLTLTYTVTVTDSQGATSDQTITVTITGTDAPAVVWIATNKPGAPSGGFWKDGANWETGTTPIGTDDVIVITDQLHGLTPSYPVTIDAAAFANSLTMNDFDTTEGHTVPEMINKSTLTITQTLTLDADSMLTNLKAGTISVGGKAEFSGSSVLANAGYMTLAGGGDFAKSTSITNSGIIELSGGTLTTLTEIHNAGGTLKVDGGTTLIVSTATVDGGTISVLGTLELDGTSLIENGTLNNSGVVNVKGTTEFANETVGNTALGTIEVFADDVLTVDKGSIINNAGNVIVDSDAEMILNDATLSGGVVKGEGDIHVTGPSTIGSGATVSVATVTVDAQLTLDGITVSGSTVTDNASIVLGDTVKLQGGAEITGGPVTNNGTLEISGPATLLNDVVTNNGTVKVDGGQTLTLSGTEISGGAINNYSGLLGGTIDVTDDSTIDTGVTLNKGGVTVESDVTLTFGDATVSASKITNGGTVKVETDKKLNLAGATLTGGALTIAGTLASSGITTITDANISNSYLLESTLGGLLTLMATTSTPVITNDGGTIRANNAELDIKTESVTNTGTLGAINDGTLKLISTQVTNTGGAVSIESGSTLDLSDATVTGGTLTIAGTLESTGTSAITSADITNTGTITVTSGTLTIDPNVIHTLTNNKLLQANGGELDITGEAIVNTADTKALSGGILKLSTLSVTNDGGTVTVDSTSKLYLTDVSINGGSLNNSGNVYGVSGSNNVTGAVTNSGTIEVQAGTLNLSGGLTGAGTLIIDDKATLELAGADAQTVTFAGGADTLQLDSTSHDFTGTITGQSSTGGTFTATGDADITTSKGDALDFTASGGTSDSPGNIVLTPTGALTGANNGVAVTQNGIGDVSLTTVGDVTGTAGEGIVLHDGATGAGDITATIGGAASGTIGLDVIANGDGDVTITNNGHVSGTSSFGISVVQDAADATGSTHITNTGSVIGADGSAAIHIQENTTGTALIDNSGTIGPADASSVVSTTYAIVETGGAITINNTGHINGDISVASATFNNELGGTWTVSGTSVFGTLSTIDNVGEIDLHDGASVSSTDGTSFAITNSGHIESWGTASITGSITNTDTIEVHTDGTLSLFGSLSGSGSVTIDTGATLVVDATVSQTVTFAGDGSELSIQTTDFGGAIAGLAATDKIDLSSIDYGLGTSAVYVANKDASTGGTLTISDAEGHHISLTLTGADYSHANFAGSDDGTGHTLITVNAADDAPKFTADGATLAASFSELGNTTNSQTSNPTPAATGSIAFTDVDLTDRPGAQITHQDVTWLDTNHTTQLTLTPTEVSALEAALSLQHTGNNNGTVGWSYSIADGTLDFLAQDQTATVVSTITLNDGHNNTDTTQVTVTITGANDAPTLDAANAGTLTDTAATDSFTDLTGQLVGHDADSGETATLSYAVLDADSKAETTVAGHYGSLTVNANGTYDYTPDADAINALSAGSYTDTFTVQTTDVHGVSGTATFTVNITGANDTPVITTGATDTDKVALTETNAGFSTTGTLTVSDADTTDHVTVAVDHLDIYLDGVLQTEWLGEPSNATLLNYLTVPSGDILNGTANHGQFSWDFNSGDQAFDFLAAGHTLSLQYTISPNDGHTTGTSEIVTINIAGSNDAPTLDDATLAAVGAHDSNPAGSTVSDLFAYKFHDADDGASLHAIAVTSDSASTDQGVWQYEVAGTDQWVDVGSVSDSHALVLGTDTLVRFVPADGFSGTPDPLGVHALDDTYTGSITTSGSPATVDITAMSTDGTAPVSDKETTISTSVSTPAAPEGGPVIDTDSFTVAHDRELGTDTIYNLSVADTDSGASTDDFTVTAVTAHAPTGEDSPGSSVNPASLSGSLDDINTAFSEGVTYDSGKPAPDDDMITLTVTDNKTGASDTVNFIFNENGDTGQGITLNGTAGKDIIFAATTNDTLNGGGGKDQFVFAPGSANYDETGHPSANYSHTINDFIEGLDKIDLRQFSDVTSINGLTIAQHDGNTQVTWQQQIGVGEGSITEHESLLLKNVTATLKASDFIFHIT